MKRLTYPNLSLISTAGGVIATSYNSSQCNNASEWTSFSVRYQEYRVKAMKVTLRPVYPSSQVGIVHTSVAIDQYAQNAAATTFASVVSGERSKILGSNDTISMSCDWDKNPNAKLWTLCTSTVPVANSYGINLCTPTTPLLTASTTYFAVDIEYLVEFRSAQ